MGEEFRTPEGVKKWLTKHGYPLELQAARRFQEAGFDVWHSAFYEDPGTGKPREVDIVASKDAFGGRWGLRVTFVVECKSGQNQAWLLLGGLASRVDGAGRLTSAVQSPRARTLGPFLRRKSPVPEATLWKRSERPARGLIRVGQGNEDVAYAALMSVVAAAVGQLQFSRQLEESGDQMAEFVFPVLVVDAPLYRLSLGDADDTVLEPVTNGCVSWRHPSIARPLTVIDVVPLEDLGAFVSEAMDCVEQLLEHAGLAVESLQNAGDE